MSTIYQKIGLPRDCSVVSTPTTKNNELYYTQQKLNPFKRIYA